MLDNKQGLHLKVPKEAMQLSESDKGLGRIEKRRRKRTNLKMLNYEAPIVKLNALKKGCLA